MSPNMFGANERADWVPPSDWRANAPLTSGVAVSGAGGTTGGVLGVVGGVPGVPGMVPGTVGTPGMTVPGGHGTVTVINLMGRTFMPVEVDDPFRAADRLLEDVPIGSPVLVDFHAEATSEKQALAWYLDGRVAAVVGTHTHVPTADTVILGRGTAYQTDAGMCGDYDSVIGMVKSGATLRFWRKMPGEKLGPAEGEATICGVFVETDDTSGLARRIEPVRLGGRLAQAMPAV